jgi:hypothetical protein
VTASGSAYARDISSNLLPQLASAPVYQTGSHEVTWTESSVGTATPRFAELAITATRGSVTWSWIAIAPRASQTFVLPAMPTDLFDFNIVPTDTYRVVALGEALVPVTYDQIRPRYFGGGVQPATFTGRSLTLTYRSLD